MLVGRVVHHEIEDDPDVAFSSAGDQVIEIRERAVHRIDGVVIGNVVAEIHLRRREARGNPNGVHAELFQIIQVRGDAIQVADAVVVAIGKTAGINFIENGVLPPLMAFRIDGRRLRAQAQRQNHGRQQGGKEWQSKLRHGQCS